MLPSRVLHVMNASVGGAALSTIALAERMRRRGIESSIVCHEMGTAEDRQRIREAARGAVLFTPLYWWNKKTRAAKWKRPILELRQSAMTGHGLTSAFEVARFARAQGVDLVHTNTMVTREGARAATLLGLPHAWHVRELVGRGRHCELPLEDRALAHYLQRRASVLIANSKATAECFRPQVADDLIRVVSNGVDLSRFSPRAIRPASDKLVVAMVGHLTARNKKHPLFLRAGKLIEHPGVELRMYGQIPAPGGGISYAEELRRLQTELGVGDRVTWPGYVDVEKIMEEIDVFVQPADNESFGRVLIEAMAASVPVVSVRGGGATEIVQDEVTGLLVPPDDPRALAQAIDRLLLDQDLRARLGAAGRKRAESCYSIEAYVDGVIDAYQFAMTRPLSVWAAPTPVRVWL
jgi:glycosyltransferase involved in cell wall biosynthesis